MRRPIVLAIVALLVFAPFSVRSVWAQEWEDKSWQGVTVGEPVPYNAVSPEPAFQLLADFLGEPQENQMRGTLSMSARLDDAFPVAFEHMAGSDDRAFIPEVQGAEFMVVIIESGEFVLDVEGPGSFLVDPVVDEDLVSGDIEKVQIMDAEITYSGPDSEVRYTPSGRFVPDERGLDCTSLCTVLPGVAVQVTDGDRIIAPAGAICVWCMLNQSEHKGETQGSVNVFPLLDEGETFSWSQFDAGPTAEQGATPEQMTGAAPWAMFNPASNCKG